MVAFLMKAVYNRLHCNKQAARPVR